MTTEKLYFSDMQAEKELMRWLSEPLFYETCYGKQCSKVFTSSSFYPLEIKYHCHSFTTALSLGSGLNVD